MSKLTFANTPAAALRGAQHVVLFAPRAALRRAAWRDVVGPGLAPLVGKMVQDAEPGGLGKVLTSYTGDDAPRRVSLAVLPDAVSRHASPSRSDAIGDCAAGIDHVGARKTAVILFLDAPEHYVAAANAVGRSFPLYRRRAKKPATPAVTIAAVGPKGEPFAAPKAAAPTVETSRWSASLVDRPCAELSPADFVREARARAKGLKGVRVTVIVGKDLERKGLGGIFGVGKAAAVPPRLLVLEHGARAKGKRTVAIVGKGVVYDTGGLSLKVGGNMVGMKADMGGGAAALGAFLVLARERLPHRLICLVPLVENAVGPDSVRPDDILTMHSGKTVEVNNTDAEGRLILADAASYAARTLGADVVIDAATLTGAQLVATGKRHAAVVSNRGGLEALAVRAGLRSGDLTHPLPFVPEFYQPEFKSAVADMRNSVKDRANAQTSCAAQFIYSHIQDLDVPWLHVDLAGPAFPGKRATGFGVALLAEVVRSLTAADLAS